MNAESVLAVLVPEPDDMSVPAHFLVLSLPYNAVKNPSWRYDSTSESA